MRGWCRRWKFALGRCWVIAKTIIANVIVIAIYFGCRFFL